MSQVTGEELMTALAALRRVVRRRLRQSLSGPHGIGSHPASGHIELLRYVERHPGTGVAAAARALHLAGNSVSTQVNQLVRDGMLRRGSHPADRRAARLELTETARTHLTDWRAARAELVDKALRRLPEADRDTLAAAMPALHRLLSELDEREEDE